MSNDPQSIGGVSEPTSKIGLSSPTKSQSIGYIQTIISNKQAEKNFTKRKQLRDKGVIYPEFPKWTPTVDKTVEKSKEGASPMKTMGLKDTILSNKSPSMAAQAQGGGPHNLDLSLVREGADMTITSFDFHNQASLEQLRLSPSNQKKLKGTLNAHDPPHPTSTLLNSDRS